ncbi:MAG: hypothetical protein LBQ98_03035 [Nitrososphaerota archaeon]|jgi:hypothetical protein|nr:hypothetical protein [Nitrososphaerota archaeon]
MVRDKSDRFIENNNEGINRKLICGTDTLQLCEGDCVSFGNFKSFSGIQEVLTLVLMMVTMLVIFYVDIELTYKIGIAIFSVAVIFLSALATAMLRLQKELREKQANQA